MQVQIFITVINPKYDMLEFLKTLNKHMAILQYIFSKTPIDTNITESRFDRFESMESKDNGIP